MEDSEEVSGDVDDEDVEDLEYDSEDLAEA